jgi:hypothetical protein
VSKRTNQKYLRAARAPRARGQTWTTFLRNQAKGIWARDFLQTTDILFRPVRAFFFVEHAVRRVVLLRRHSSASRASGLAACSL